MIVVVQLAFARQTLDDSATRPTQVADTANTLTRTDVRVPEEAWLVYHGTRLAAKLNQDEQQSDVLRDQTAKAFQAQAADMRMFRPAAVLRPVRTCSSRVSSGFTAAS